MYFYILSSWHTRVYVCCSMCESLHTLMCDCEGRITARTPRKQIHFLRVVKATGSRLLSGGAAVTQHCLSPRLNPTSSHCCSPPVKIMVHLLGSHSSLCSPERDNRIPHLRPQSHWWMALMDFYCLMYPLSSSFFSKSNLLSLYRFTLSTHDLPFNFIFSLVFHFHFRSTHAVLMEYVSVAAPPPPILVTIFSSTTSPTVFTQFNFCDKWFDLIWSPNIHITTWRNSGIRGALKMIQRLHDEPVLGSKWLCL